MTHKMLVKKGPTNVIFAITNKMLDRLNFNDKIRAGSYTLHKSCEVIKTISDSDLYELGGRLISAGSISQGERLSLIEVNEENSFTEFDSITRHL